MQERWTAFIGMSGAGRRGSPRIWAGKGTDAAFRRAWPWIVGLACLLAACTPSPQANVVAYLMQRWQQTQVAGPPSSGQCQSGTGHPEPGALTGTVVDAGTPVAGISVLVAESTGCPYSAQTDAAGRYRIEGVPPGQYVPAAVGPGYEEAALSGPLGVPALVTVAAGETAAVPTLALARHRPAPLPGPLPQAVALAAGERYSATAPFPAGAAATVQVFQFERGGAVVDSLRVYQPLAADPAVEHPLLFAVFPGLIDGWEPVSVAFASQGFVLVGISPAQARGLDIEAHTLDARTALALARQGFLGTDVGDRPAVALGGSFSSAILHRLLREHPDVFRAWVTVGGISNAYTGAAAFYAGNLEIPEEYALMVPALGSANIYPLDFLRYSPVYTAAELPPTMIVHTAADLIIPIDQAYELEEALRAAQVPVDVFYYQDISHYLQIGEDLSPTGMEMFERVLAFIRRYAVDQPR